MRISSRAPYLMQISSRAPYPILPYPTLSYPTLPYPTLPYSTLPYPTLPYLTLASGIGSLRVPRPPGWGAKPLLRCQGPRMRIADLVSHKPGLPI